MSRHRSRLVAAAVVFLLLGSGRAPAQITFTTWLDAAQVVPPPASPSAAEGHGEFVLDLETRRLRYRVVTTCVAPLPQTTVRRAPEGQVGPAVFSLGYSTLDMYEGVSPSLSEGDLVALFEGGCYIEIQSGTFAQPEIRGQIRPALRLPLEVFCTASQMVPPTNSPATARGWMRLDYPERTLTYDLEVTGTVAQAAALLVGPAGSPAPFGVSLDGGGSRFTGTTERLSHTHAAQIVSGEGRVVVADVVWPLGAVGGPITQRRFVDLQADLTGTGMVPPNPLPDTGRALAVLDMQSRTLQYQITFAGAGATGVSINPGYPFQQSLGTIPVGTGSGPWAGTTPPLGDAVVWALLNGGMHVTVSTTTFPQGQVRGPLLVNPLHYGFGSDAVTGRVRMTTRGRPVLGSTTFAVTATGLPPGVPAWLFVSLGSETMLGQPLPVDLQTGAGPARSYWWIDSTVPLGFTTSVDAGGLALVPLPLPADPALQGLDVFMQWAVASGTTVAALSVSEALHVTLR